MTNTPFYTQPGFPVLNGLAPPDSMGPRLLAYSFPVSNQVPFTFDIIKEIDGGQIENIQCMYVDCSAYLSPVVVTFSEIPQVFYTLKPGKQYILPVFGKVLGNITFSNSDLFAASKIVRVAFLNMPLPFIEFGVDNSLVKTLGITNGALNNPNYFNISGQGTGTVNGSIQNPGEGKGIIFKANISVLTAGSVTFNIQGLDGSSGNFYTILASAAIAATGEIPPMRVYPGLTNTANQFANDLLPFQWRVQAVVVTGPATWTSEFDLIS